MNTTKLKEKALRATSGKWVAFISTPSKTFAVHTVGDKRCGDIVGWAGFDDKENAEANAEFIAAASPLTVLSLLDEIERLKQKLALQESE